ncbi:conserved hypothetical protein [Candidatus Magnetomoraceae bacterium gMMP-15]
MTSISGIRKHIFIGSREIVRSPEVKLLSHRHAPLNSAWIDLHETDRSLIRSIKKDETVEIRIGYRDVEPFVWKGTVRATSEGKTIDQITVHAVGLEKPLDSVRITQSWRNETPEAIVKYAAQQSGLPINRIDSTGCVLPHCIANNRMLWEVVNQVAHTCQKSYNINMNKWAFWLGADGLNWGDFDEPGDIPIIATGQNLINYAPDSQKYSWNKIETFLLPDLQHSMLFRLKDTRRNIDETFRALRVIHRVSEQNRTYIWYGEERSLFE